MGRPTWQPHPGKDATRGEWMEAIRILQAEAALARRMTGIALMGAAIIAAIIISHA